MLAGDFFRKLKKLNKKLKVYCGNDDSKPAGLFMIHNREYTNICSIDKNFVPKYTIVDKKNHILKGGWQRTLKILIAKKLVNKKKVKQLFGSIDNYRPPTYATEVASIEQGIRDTENRHIYHGQFDSKGKAKMKRNEILEIQKAIKDSRI